MIYICFFAVSLLSQREIVRKYWETKSRAEEDLYLGNVKRWERIYLEEGAEGLMRERRGGGITRKVPTTKIVGAFAFIGAKQLLPLIHMFSERQKRMLSLKLSSMYEKRYPTALFTGSVGYHLAQRVGFEPTDGSPPSHDFESCAFGRSAISASPYIVHDIPEKINRFCGFPE